ncbi:hypothetical protein HDU96_004310 [Phlyctochytrium bullatum]|nr:hypothetical protein HDU96_004310 [Phlyctochytrium bullatum]
MDSGSADDPPLRRLRVLAVRPGSEARSHPIPEKKKRGRPRKIPIEEKTAAPKRPRGRPRKYPLPTSAAPADMSTPETPVDDATPEVKAEDAQMLESETEGGYDEQQADDSYFPFERIILPHRDSNDSEWLEDVIEDSPASVAELAPASVVEPLPIASDQQKQEAPPQKKRGRPSKAELARRNGLSLSPPPPPEETTKEKRKRGRPPKVRRDSNEGSDGLPAATPLRSLASSTLTSATASPTRGTTISHPEPSLTPPALSFRLRSSPHRPNNGSFSSDSGYGPPFIRTLSHPAEAAIHMEPTTRRPNRMAAPFSPFSAKSGATSLFAGTSGIQSPGGPEMNYTSNRMEERDEGQAGVAMEAI